MCHSPKYSTSGRTYGSSTGLSAAVTGVSRNTRTASSSTSAMTTVMSSTFPPCSVGEQPSNLACDLLLRCYGVPGAWTNPPNHTAVYRAVIWGEKAIRRWLSRSPPQWHFHAIARDILGMCHPGFPRLFNGQGLYAVPRDLASLDDIC